VEYSKKDNLNHRKCNGHEYSCERAASCIALIFQQLGLIGQTQTIYLILALISGVMTTPDSRPVLARQAIAHPISF
jgi:hypothetical protein